MMYVGWCDVLFTGVLFCDVHKFTQRKGLLVLTKSESKIHRLSLGLLST